MFIQIITKRLVMFLPGLIQHLEIVAVQLDLKQATRVHRVPLSLIDVGEQKYLKHNLPAL